MNEQFVPAFLYLYLAPVAVKNIRDYLECEETYTYRHFYVRDGQINGTYCVEVFNKEACILEEHQKPYVEYKCTSCYCCSFLCITELIYKQPRKVVYRDASDKQEHPYGFSPCVEYH